MSPVIDISDELFARLQTHAIGFGDTPAAVIERLLNNVENVAKNDKKHHEDRTGESSPRNDKAIAVNTRVNPKQFLKEKFPELLKYKRSSSRMWESKEKKSYLDNWWFNFTDKYLEINEFIVFAGALDYENKDFRVFKVPTEFLLQNIDKIDKTQNGWINLFIHMQDLIDLRNKKHLSFADFVVN